MLCTVTLVLLAAQVYGEVGPIGPGQKTQYTTKQLAPEKLPKASGVVSIFFVFMFRQRIFPRPDLGPHVRFSKSYSYRHVTDLSIDYTYTYSYSITHIGLIVALTCDMSCHMSMPWLV